MSFYVDGSNKPIKTPSETPSKLSVLDEAKRIVSGSRNDDYGTPERNHARIAQMWSAYLGVEVTPRDVCAMMVLVKVSRDRNAAKRDNAVDIAGYAYLMDTVSDCLGYANNRLSTMKYEWEFKTRTYKVYNSQ